MNPILGLSITVRELRAVLAEGGRVLWTGNAAYTDYQDASTAVARLAAELPRPARRVRVVLERDVVQLRTLIPAPPLSAAATRQYVALDAARLFRKNGGPLVTDCRVLRGEQDARVLLAAAAAESLVDALSRGCEAAGLAVEAMGPAAEVLPRALAGGVTSGEVSLDHGGTGECLSLGPDGTWRSRLSPRDLTKPIPRWAPALQDVGDGAARFAAAYGASVHRPVLDLLPSGTKAARSRRAWRRVRAVAAVGAGLWLAAGLTHIARLRAAERTAGAELEAMRPAVDSTLALRRELALAAAAVATMRVAEAGRSRVLLRLADLTTVLGDSVWLTSLQLDSDSILRVTGHAPQATRVVAQLETLAWVRDARLELPAVRERADGRDLDRFSVLARLETKP